MRFNSKEEVRRYVWNVLIKNNVCKFPCFKHIPNFVGVEKTIENILNLKEFINSKNIFISPDTPQRIIIKYILGKKEIYMATPRLKKGFCKINKYGNIREILNTCEYINNLPKIDFALIGSVAVDLKGNRIGKGGGFGDREIKILREINDKVIIATNIHDLQIIEDLSYLMEEHDEKIDLIITPNKIIWV